MSERERVIYHSDCNNFFASVEEALYPELRKVPMAICGNPESRRGVIVSKNELAKRYDVRTDESIFQAIDKCPSLVLRPTRRPQYIEYNRKINEIYSQYTDLVEPCSIDESAMDVTGTLSMFGGDAEKLAHAIRERVHRELDITVSIGVSFNRVFAKIASNLKKPNAVSVITRDNFQEILWPLPVRVIPMVGTSTEAVLKGMGIHMVRDLAGTDERKLEAKLGKVGKLLHTNANGLDATPVRHIDDPVEIQSVSSGNTYEYNIASYQEIRSRITALADDVATQLRKKGMKCLTVQVTIKDPNFKIITRQKGLPSPTWLAADLASTSMELIEASWKIGRPIRMLAVTAAKLLPKEEAWEQQSIFDTPESGVNRDKREKLELTIDQIRGKYGAGSISTAGAAYDGGKGKKSEKHEK